MSHLEQAQAAFARGDLKSAEQLAARAIESSPNAMTLAAFAKLVGVNGQRARAAQILSNVMGEYPNDGLLRTLLGEQQVRLGQWEAGTQNFVTGLSIDRSEGPVVHSMGVVADLVRAHQAGRVAKEDAKKFINGLLYNVPRASERLKVFLAASRRALESGQTLEASGAEVPSETELLPGSGAGASSGRRDDQTRAQQHVQQRVQQGGQQRTRPPERPRGQRQAETHGRSQHSVLPMQSHGPVDELRVDLSMETHGRNNTVGAGITMGRRAGDRSIAKLMAQDRQLNEEIQGTLGQLGLPRWPSDKDVPLLDDMPAMRPALLGFTRADMQSADELRFTEGSINAEIILERCSHSVREASAQGSSRPVSLRTADITKFEVALWDGALDRMRPVPSLFDDDPDYDWSVLAIGKFIGDVICKNYGGFWNYPRDPEQAYVIVGFEKIEVLKFAREWIRAQDKDDVSFEKLIRRAAAASDESEKHEVFIDVVTGLDSRALALKLAEQWILYRSHPSDVSLVEVASDITPSKTDEHLIIFFINAEWAPKQAQGRNGAGLDAEGRVAIAYDRDTDEFFILGSRKHFALFLARAGEKFDGDSLPKIAALFNDYHCPGLGAVWGGSDEDKPRVEAQNGGADFWLTARGEGSRIKWVIRYREDALLPWSIEFAE